MSVNFGTSVGGADVNGGASVGGADVHDVLGGTVVSSVAASADDARENISDGGMSLTIAGPVLNTSSIHGARFALSIPQGARIVEAKLQLTAGASTSGDHTTTVQGEAADNAAVFTTNASNISSRALTTASVEWSIPAWTANDRTASQLSPDIKDIVQEVVDRAGWASGHYLALIFQRTGGASNRTFASWDHATLQEPTLTVVWG